MGKQAVLALRAVIVALFGGCVVLQGVLVTLMVRDLSGAGGGGVLPRAAAVMLIVVLGIVCAQTVLWCVWRLSTLVRRGKVFTPSAFRYVDVAGGAFAVAALLLWALGVVLAPGEAVAPGVVLLIGAVGLGVAGVALVVLVLRILLAQAVARDAEACRMQAELAGVI
ncbi:DUF2975 domain-containing protein [Streptomyces sp. NPDC091972]|uniref:DUF2975 domain-containing protein n=1 Tax=Streptomyces sp. NPDC091972 TaxID=3366007 RepID=UPI00380EA02B